MIVNEAMIAEYFGERGSGSDSLAVGRQIDQKTLSLHQKAYGVLPSGEPILALNTGRMLGVPFTGFILTTNALVFKTVKDTFLTGIFPFGGRMGALPLSEIQSFHIGDHDHCFGTAYMGHQLVINGAVIGLVRLGNGAQYDDKALTDINGFADYLSSRSG